MFRWDLDGLVHNKEETWKAWTNSNYDCIIEAVTDSDERIESRLQ